MNYLTLRDGELEPLDKSGVFSKSFFNFQISKQIKYTYRILHNDKFQEKLNDFSSLLYFFPNTLDPSRVSYTSPNFA